MKAILRGTANPELDLHLKHDAVVGLTFKNECKCGGPALPGRSWAKLKNRSAQQAAVER
jgi:hypothetical protein